MQRIDGRKNAHDKPKKEYPLTTTKRNRRGDKGGTVERIYWGIMVSEMCRDSAAQTLHNISRDMVGVYYTYSFSARSSVVSAEGAP